MRIGIPERDGFEEGKRVLEGWKIAFQEGG